MLIVLNTLVSALIIGVAAWLSRRYPVNAGFLIALPLATMLVLPLAYLQHRDPDSTFQMARSILVALPITLLFFVPFLMRDRFSFGARTPWDVRCCRSGISCTAPSCGRSADQSAAPPYSEAPPWTSMVSPVK